MVIQEGNRSNNVAQDFLFSKPAVASWHVTHASVARCPGPQPGSTGTRVWDESHLSQCDRAIGAEYFDRQYCPHRERARTTSATGASDFSRSRLRTPGPSTNLHLEPETNEDG